MSTTIDLSAPISDEDFEAKLTAAVAKLEGRSAEELTDEAIAKHLFEFEAGGDNLAAESEPDEIAVTNFVTSPARTEFSKDKVIKVTKEGGSKPNAGDGTTFRTYKCFSLWSRGLVG